MGNLAEKYNPRYDQRSLQRIGENTRTFDAIIIGAGPSGLMAAYELRDIRVLVIEKGTTLPKRVCPMITECKGCSKCGEVEGLGGAGGYSDGKLCLGPVGIHDKFIGGNYAEEVQGVDQIFKELLNERYVESKDCINSCNVTDEISLKVTRVANLGSSTVRYAFERLYEQIRDSGGMFLFNTEVTLISDEGAGFLVKTKSGREFRARNIILSTGKCDSTVVPYLIKNYKLDTIPNEPTLGFRLSAPNAELRKIKELGSNPKLRSRLPNGDTIKTHCFSFGGEVMAYACGDYFLVGGRADSGHPTEFANVNVLYKFSSGAPNERKELVHSILRRIKADYPKNVIYQDLNSFLWPDRTPKETCVVPCRGGILGSILPYYPPYVVDAMRNFVTDIANIYGINLENATLFAPAAEWYNDAVAVSMEMETAKRGLYVVGDGASITQGIISAAVTGRRAAQRIKRLMRQ